MKNAVEKVLQLAARHYCSISVAGKSHQKTWKCFFKKKLSFFRWSYKFRKSFLLCGNKYLLSSSTMTEAHHKKSSLLDRCRLSFNTMSWLQGLKCWLLSFEIVIRAMKPQTCSIWSHFHNYRMRVWLLCANRSFQNIFQQFFNCKNFNSRTNDCATPPTNVNEPTTF